MPLRVPMRLEDVEIAPMSPQERAAVHALLTSHKLPVVGFDDGHVVRLVARNGTDVLGSAAIEVYGRYGVLRSVAVRESWRGRELGSQLTREALAMAGRLGLSAVYLLTESASEFFPKFGFEPVSRGDVPEQVRESVEFTSACPASAACFVVALPQR